MAESEISRLNIRQLYEQGFDDFSISRFCKNHRLLFGDVYERAGKFRIINISKREPELGGRSVWYTNDEYIEETIYTAFNALPIIKWNRLNTAKFVIELAQYIQTL